MLDHTGSGTPALFRCDGASGERGIDFRGIPTTWNNAANTGEQKMEEACSIGIVIDLSGDNGYSNRTDSQSGMS